MTMIAFSVPGVDALHAPHYTVEQFNAAVQAGSLAHYEEGMPIEDVHNIFYNVARSVYCEWNDLDTEAPRAMQFCRELMEKMTLGLQSSEEIAASGSGLLDPVHGITLEDWAATNAKLASGAELDALLEVLGVEQPQWDEASTVWTARMSADTSFSIVTIYGNAFTNSNIGKYAHADVAMAVVPDSPAKAAAKDSLPLYAEIFCAQSTAYEFGIDGSQFVKDTWGLTLGDWGEIAAHWSTQMRDDVARMREFSALLDEYNQKYKQQFAEAQGGNIGDDISF